MLESIALIAGVASSILSAVGYVKGLNTERKHNISEFFLNIADTVDSAVLKFKNGEVPHGACDMMRRYAMELPAVLDGTMDANKIQEYSDTLYQAHDIESLHMAVQKDENALVELEKTASKFRVAANVIKISR